MQHLLKVSENTQLSWRNLSIQNRISFLPQLAKLLLENKEKYAICITTEMHKPISQAIAEVEKCALLCNYYYENAETFLAKKNIIYKKYLKLH